MRNSSLVEWFCAENVTGLKLATEASDTRMCMVEERSNGTEGRLEGLLELLEVRMPV